MLLALVVSKVGIPIVIYDVVGITRLGSILSTIAHILGLIKKLLIYASRCGSMCHPPLELCDLYLMSYVQ
jgi:hypothetical protein